MVRPDALKNIYGKTRRLLLGCSDVETNIMSKYYLHGLTFMKVRKLCGPFFIVYPLKKKSFQALKLGCYNFYSPYCMPSFEK